MKIEFEGEDLGEITTKIEDFLGQIGSGTAAPATKTGTKNAAKNKVVEKITAESIRELMLSIDDTAAKKKVLADFGVTKISDITEDQFDEVYAEFKKLK